MEDLDKIRKQLKELIIEAVKNRAKNKKTGVLFSGGIDSVIISFILKKLGIDFTCYTAAVEDDFKTAEDMIWAEKAAKELGFRLKVNKIKLNQAEKIIKKTAKILNKIENKVVHVGVGSVMVAVSEYAKKDKIKYLFSGLGSEEIFAGYQRHGNAKDINKECKKGLKNMEQGDLLRDGLISKHEKIKFLTPFLDKKLVEYALKIPGKYKIKNNIKKYILRLTALDLGIPKELAFRKKRAAQYGSNFDKAIMKLAKKNKFKYKKHYLNNQIKLGALVSGGKDSLFALYKMIKQGYDVKCLITVKSKNPHSYMFHTPNIDLVKEQAEALELPLVSIESKGEKEKELLDLQKVIKEAKQEYNLDGIITGALFSTYQKNRIDKIGKELGLQVFSPLWHTDQEELMKQLLENKFKIIITAIAAEGLSKDDLGKEIDNKFIDKMVKLNKKIGISLCGEGGEYESLVLDCPIFNKKIKITKANKIMESEYNGFYIIKKVKLIKK